MKAVVATSIAIAVLAVAGCGGSSSSSADEQDIQAVADQYAQTAQDGDFKATCALFTQESLQRIKELKVFGSCEELMKEGLGNLPDSEIQKLADLTDLQVVGDTATAQARGEEVRFTKVNGEWKLDVSEPDE